MSSESETISNDLQLIIQNQLQNNNNYTVVIFSMSWCHTCKKLDANFLEEYSKKYNFVVEKYVVDDYDDDDEILDNYNLTKFPTLMLFKNGNKISEKSSSDKSVIYEWTSNYIFDDEDEDF